MKFHVLTLFLLAAPVLAQGEPPFDLAEGDRVRVWVGSDEQGRPAPVKGRVLTVGADSLALFADTGLRVAWPDVVRVERAEENRTGETIGIALGALIGGGIGWVVGADSGEIGGEVLALPGAMIGSAVGAKMGSDVAQPWVEVPRGAPPVSAGFRFGFTF